MRRWGLATSILVITPASKPIAKAPSTTANSGILSSKGSGANETVTAPRLVTEKAMMMRAAMAATIQPR